MQSSVSDVVEEVLKDEETSDLESHQGQGGKWDIVRGHTEVGADRVEGEDKRSFASEMSEEDDFGTFPDLSVADEFAGLKLPLVKIRNSVDDQPRNSSTKVHDLVHNETHDTGSK